MNINSPSFTKGGGTDLKIPEVTAYPTNPQANQLVNFNGRLFRYDTTTGSWLAAYERAPYPFTYSHQQRIFLLGTSGLPDTGKGSTTFNYPNLTMRGIRAFVGNGALGITVFFIGDVPATDVPGFRFEDTYPLYTNDNNAAGITYERVYSDIDNQTYFQWILDINVGSNNDYYYVTYLPAYNNETVNAELVFK